VWLHIYCAENWALQLQKPDCYPKPEKSRDQIPTSAKLKRGVVMSTVEKNKNEKAECIRSFASYIYAVQTSRPVLFHNSLKSSVASRSNRNVFLRLATLASLLFHLESEMCEQKTRLQRCQFRSCYTLFKVSTTRKTNAVCWECWNEKFTNYNQQRNFL